MSNLPWYVVKSFIFYSGFYKISFCFVNWTVCPNGNFGHQCEDDCHCLNSEICDKDSGNCYSGCAPGWTGDNCQQSKAIKYP